MQVFPPIPLFGRSVELVLLRMPTLTELSVFFGTTSHSARALFPDHCHKLQVRSGPAVPLASR